MADTTRPRPRPVFDPALPQDVLRLLRAPGAPLVAGSQPAPVRRRPGAARVLARLIWIPLFALFYGVLPGGWITLFFLTSLEEDDLMTGVFRWGRRAVLAMMLTPAILTLLILLGLDTAALAVAAVSFTGWAAGALRHVGEPPAARAARDRHGRYLLPGDFDKPAARLLVRTQSAVDEIMASDAHRFGLLDDINNAVTLPHQEWEIALALAEHTRLRRDRALQQEHRLSGPVRAMLAAQRRALDLSAASVTSRIEALETYAHRTRDTDDALHEWRVLQRIPEQNARYRDLLARTVRDDLAQDEIARLAADAQQAESALRTSITQTLTAARSLPPT